MKIKRLFFLLFLVIAFISCKNEQESHDAHSHDQMKVESNSDTEKKDVTQLKNKLTGQGYKIFDYIDEKTGDTILMQQYFIAFLKRGANSSQSKTETDSLQALHMAHLGRMYEEGYADISGPFGDDGDIRGITIYNVPTLQIADSLANMDPMVQAGRLEIEIHPWWAAKGFPLR